MKNSLIATQITTLNEHEQNANALLAKHTTNFVIYTDPHGVINWVNKHFEDFTGYHLSEIVGMSACDLLQGPDADSQKSYEIREAIRTKSNCRTIITNYTKSGKEYQADINITPVFNEDGELINFIAIQQDVTIQSQKRKKVVASSNIEAQQNIELQKFNILYRTLLEKTSDCITSLDSMGNILFANQTWLSKMEYALDEVMLTSIFNYIHPNSKNHCIHIFSSIQDIQKEIPVTYSLISKSGKEIQIEGVVQTKFKNGQLYTVDSHLRDVTQISNLKKGEEISRKLVQIYKTAIDASAIVSITDCKGVITYVNENFCKLSGYREDELLNQTHTIINSGYHGKHFFKDLWGTINKGQIWKGVIRNRAKNGDYYWVDSTIVPFPVGENTYEYVSIRYDITPIKKAEEETNRLKSFYENILNNIPVDIAVFDKNHKYVFLNKEAIGDDSLRTWMIGKDDFDYAALKGLPESFAQKRRDIFNQARNSAGDVVWMDTQVSKSGDVKYKERRFHTFAAKETVVGYAVDVTLLHSTQLELYDNQSKLINLNKNLEHEIENRVKELRESNANLESFAYSISHDLKTPLRQIGSFSDLLKRSLMNDDKQEAQEHFKYIDDGVSLLSTRITSLLDFSRYGIGKMNISEFTLREEFDKAFNLYIKEYNQIHYTFVNNIQSRIMADISLIGAVAENLISNAVKYSIPKGEIHIEVGQKKVENEIIYYVRDKGVGFDMKYYDKIFALFQRLHQQSYVEGMGIGLSHVKRIIERHNGRIWAESEVGEGSTFYFTLHLG